MKYLVNFKHGNRKSFKVWDGNSTLLLGNPTCIFLSKTEDGIRAIPAPFSKFQPQQWNNTSLNNGVKVNSGLISLKLQSLNQNVHNEIQNLVLHEQNVTVNDDDLKKGAIISSLVFILLLVIGSLLPKPDEKELVPEQFAKIILTKPKVKVTKTTPSVNQGAIDPLTKQASGTKGAQTQANLKQAKTMVNALRSKAIQNSIHGLLKGGMTSFLKTSNYLHGTDFSALGKSIVSNNAVTGVASSLSAGINGKASGSVEGIGSGGRGLAGVGYGSAAQGGVSGQGKGYIGIEADNAAVDEGLTKEEVARVIHSHLSEIRYCHETSMLKMPGIEGKLMLAFVIGGSGSVKDANVKESSLTDGWLEDCVIRRLRKWPFPQPKGGVDVAISYPFIFKNLGR